MTLKEIIVDKLIFGFKQNKPKWWDYEAYLRFIEPIIRGAVNSVTSNITTTDNWQVIASGEVKNIVYQTGQVVITFNKLPEQLSAGNIICGKNIEIAIRVKQNS